MKNRTKIIICILIVIAILVGAFTVILFNKNQTAEEQIREPEQIQQPIEDSKPKIDSKLNIIKDIRPKLAHGTKTKEYQKYIVLHDTEGDGSGTNVINSWDSNNKYVAAQFVINKDGSIVQCVEMDQIAHHAGFGDTGHNSKYGTPEDGRDDMRGTQRIGSWASDYGMNAWSIGIEIVHIGGSGEYPEAQLKALDNLIEYIDEYYGGNAGKIIDHKAWRSGNSDTSKEFAKYLANYQKIRKHI